MKRALSFSMCLILMIVLSGCSAFSHDHVFETEVSRTLSTCIVQGERVMKCNQCEETIVQELPLGSHNVLEWKIVKQPTVTEWGSAEGICTVCNEVTNKMISKIGSSSFTPLEMDTKEFYKEICNGQFKDYEGLYLKLSGKVTYVSDYGDMIGYYLYGKQGKGVCCWVYSWQTKKRLANVGDAVTFVGEVKNEGSNHVELIMCELVEE